MNKEDKIKLMTDEIMGGDPTPIQFDPFVGAADCMLLWERFSDGRSVEVSSYMHTGAGCPKWVARRNNTRHQDYLEVAAEGWTMIEAMAECMFRASQKDKDNPKVNSRKLSAV